jgi:hypothetical protein
MMVIRRVLLVALFAAVLVGGWSFAHRNAERVAVDLLFASFGDVALWLALVVSFACGVGAALLLSAVGLTRAGLLTRRYRKAVAGLEGEVHQLRNLPLSDDDSPVDAASGAPGGGHVRSA